MIFCYELSVTITVTQFKDYKKAVVVTSEPLLTMDDNLLDRRTINQSSIGLTD